MSTQFPEKSHLKNLINENKLIGKAENVTMAGAIALKQAWFNDMVNVGTKCCKCGSDKKLTLDHTIPVMLLEQLGVDEKRSFMPDNYEIMCKRCNTFKSHRLDFTNPRTKKLLLELLNDIE